jgi:hypothetical protein
MTTVSLPRDIDLLIDGALRPDDLIERLPNSTVHRPRLGPVLKPGCDMTAVVFVIRLGGQGGGIRQGRSS